VSQRALQSSAAPAEEGGALVFRGSLVEPATKVVWRLEERLEPAGDAVKLSYDLVPESDTPVGEVCLFMDLPIDGWHGQEAVLWPARGAAFPEQAPKERHFLAGRARRAYLGRGAALTSLAFGRPVLCTVQDTREYQGVLYQLYARLSTDGAMKAGEHCRLDLTLKPRDPEGLPVEPSYRSAAPLHVGPVTLPPGRIECFRRVELPLDVMGTWDTPFDADQVRVDAHVTTPAGREQVVPAFYTRPYRLERDAGGVWAEPDGEPGWRLRYAATEPGRHTLYVTAQDRTGEQRSPEVAFAAAAGADPGFLRVSRQDPHYFAFDSGRPYFAVGENTATGPVFSYDTWLKRLGDAGGNYARVWMCSSCFGISRRPSGTASTSSFAWRPGAAFRARARSSGRVQSILTTAGTVGRVPPRWTSSPTPRRGACGRTGCAT
ncbi:MAG: DUF5060 domain-containing protein, partial [Armatimonadetes bacterium]|nr:DUF5060 domain-containing protein [Armatimonadota bacterium]